MMLIQIFFVVLCGIALIKVGVRFRHKELHLIDTLFWSVVWVGGVVIVLKPDLTFYMARFLGVGRGADVIVYSAIVVIFFILFRLTIAVERFNKELTVLTRHRTIEGSLPASKDTTKL